MDIHAALLDADLIHRVAQRDQAAFDMLYDRYAGLVYSVAIKVLGSRQDAEEVVIDVFAQAWKQSGRYEAGRGRVDAWLLVMARSRALDKVRARLRDGRVAEAAEADASLDPLQAAPGPEQDAIVAERRQAVVAALAELPENQRRPLELAYYKGLSQSEIAEATGEALGTVKTRMRLGMSKLRGALSSWWSV